MNHMPFLRGTRQEKGQRNVSCAAYFTLASSTVIITGTKRSPARVVIVTLLQNKAKIPFLCGNYGKPRNRGMRVSGIFNEALYFPLEGRGQKHNFFIKYGWGGQGEERRLTYLRPA